MNTEVLEEQMDDLNGRADTVIDLLKQIHIEQKKQTSHLYDIENRLSYIESNTDKIE